MKTKYKPHLDILHLIILVLPMISGISACKKLVNVDAPLTNLNAQNVFATDATAISAVTGIYTQMSGNNLATGGFSSISLTAGLSADELSLYSGVISSLQYYYKNALTSQNTGSYDSWNNVYTILYFVNSTIVGLNESNGLTPAIKSQLLGEAYFLRAFYYFYLVNLYGDVPLVLGTDYSVNAILPRSSKDNVYAQIVNDLHLAQGLLSANYLDGTLLVTTTEKTRPTKWAATALLARTYLYTNNWTGADSAASAVIGAGYSLAPLSGVFLRNSSEAIWQLQPVTGTTKNTFEAILYIIPSTGLNTGQNPVYMSSNLVNSFEPNDQRTSVWTGQRVVGGVTYFYPYKYKINSTTAAVSEYIMVMRLAEQYLIRSEARTEEGNIGGALADLNTIRSRASLPAATAATQTGLESAILHERQVELFTEWGNRWFDLKRTGTVDSLMGTAGICVAKGGTWSSNWQLYPIPFTDIQDDVNLAQNEGY